MKFDPSLEKQTRMERAGALYQKGASLRQAAHTTSVSYSGLRKWLASRDIDRRPPGRHLQVTKQEVKDLVRAHQHEHKSLRELAKATSHDRGAIALAIRRAGFMTYTAQQMRSLLQKRRDGEFVEKVIGLYGEGYPIKEVAAHLHIDARRVRRIIRAKP